MPPKCVWKVSLPALPDILAGNQQSFGLIVAWWNNMIVWLVDKRALAINVALMHTPELQGKLALYSLITNQLDD